MRFVRISCRRGLAVTALLLAGACSEQKTPERHATPVKVQEVSSATAGAGIRYSANIRPDVQVDVAFKVGGYVESLMQVQGADGRSRNLQDGDVVAKGTVLARLRESEYRDRLTEAQSALTQAKADLERSSQLYENQSIAKADYDAATARATGAQARYDQAQSTLRDTGLTSPLEGTIQKKNIEVGTLVSPGAPAFVIADTRSVKVVFGVPDVRVGAMHLGDEETITTEAMPGVAFHGRITRIATTADPNSRVFDVECSIPNPEGKLRVGMTASLQVGEAAAAAPVAVVPLNSIVRPKADPKGYAVFVVETKDGKQEAVERVIQLGDMVGNAIAVTEGLKAGEKVIVTGATLVSDGDEVRVIP